MKNKLIHLLGGFSRDDLDNIKKAALTLRQEIVEKDELIDVLANKCQLLREQMETLKNNLQH